MSFEKISIGSDHGGFLLKAKIVKFLKTKKCSVRDFGTFSEVSMDYPDTAFKVAQSISNRTAARGILICKTGVGNCIVANKLKGVRAALCHDVETARLSRAHNDANVLVLGALFVDEKLARKICAVWLKTPFEGGRHLRRIKKIERIEELCLNP